MPWKCALPLPAGLARIPPGLGPFISRGIHMPRHPLAAALACTLLLAPVVLPAFAAEPEIAAAKVKWDMPWKQGMSLQYATEYLSDEKKDGARERSRSTDNTTVRI